MTTDLDLFNAAREAGMPPNLAVRYVWHVRHCEAEGREPLDPAVAAISASMARTAGTENPQLPTAEAPAGSGAPQTPELALGDTRTPARPTGRHTAGETA